MKQQPIAICATFHLKSGQSFTAYVRAIEVFNDAAGNITGLNWRSIDGAMDTLGQIVPSQIAALTHRDVYDRNEIQ